MLKDKLKLAATTALKSGEGRKVEALRFLVSLLDKKELSLPPGGMKGEDEVAVLRKELKNKEESRAMFLKGNRNDLAADVDFEIEILREYLPVEIGDEEITRVAGEVVAQRGSVFGVVMGETMKRLAGKAGGDRVAKIVKELID